MKTLQQSLTAPCNTYHLEQTAPLEKILFLDIETTGFTAKSSLLYLIGAAYYAENAWNLIQWFAESPDDEKDLLTSFFAFAKRYTHLIHFNGNNFDLPYLEQKCRLLKLDYNFDSFEGIDLYRRVAPYKSILRLPNCKQKTIEQFLKIDRADPYSGGELISVYHEYVRNPTDFAFNALTLHNAEDMQGMLEILPILSYCDLFLESHKVKKAQANTYTDIHKSKKQELLLKLSLNQPLKIPVSFSANGCYFSGEGKEGNLKIPIYEEELKYFYSNYKDYYYLPAEDIAMHRSVASFVDKKFREPASPANCYTRKFSCYLPQWSAVFEPFFKREYKGRELFFELTDDLKTQRNAFSKYAEHILQMMLKHHMNQTS